MRRDVVEVGSLPLCESPCDMHNVDYLDIFDEVEDVLLVSARTPAHVRVSV